MARVTINQAVIDKAKRDAVPGCKEYQITDARASGLVLRVGARGPRWGWRGQVFGKARRLDLGPVDEWSIAEARELATIATAMVRSRQGLPTEEWLQTMRVRYGKAAPVRVAAEDPRLALKWTFADARTAYLDEVQRTRRKATHDDYRKTLSHAAFAKFERRSVGSITLAQIAETIAAVHSEGKESTAEGMVRKLKPFWDWLSTDPQARKSGVAVGVLDRLRAPERTLREDDGERIGEYVPPPLEVGRILAIARSGALDPTISAALEISVLCCQRRRTTVTARVGYITEISEHEGLWSIPPAHRKTGREKKGKKPRLHVLPLTAPAMAAFRRAIALGEESKSQWVLPGTRPRRAGTPVTHLSESTLTHTMALLPGVQASPHDLRRALATHGEKLLRMKRSETKLILDHAQGAESDATEVSYALHDRTHESWPVMDRWTAFCEEQCARAIERDPRLLDPGWLKAEIAKARRPQERELLKAAE